MKFTFDFLPVVIFYIVLKVYDLYVATAVIIVISLLQLLFYWLRYREINKMLLFITTVVVVMGSITLALHNDIFIKWKPTIVFWVFALVFLGSQFIGKAPIPKRMLGEKIALPDNIWLRLNAVWIAFFVLVGAINLFIAYNFSTDAWANFKLIGILGLTFIFSIAQAIYLEKHMQNPPGDIKPSS